MILKLLLLCTNDFRPHHYLVSDARWRNAEDCEPGSGCVHLCPGVCRWQGISLSAAISELVRRAENVTETEADSARLVASPDGYFIIAGTGNTVTSEMVKEASEYGLI